MPNKRISVFLSVIIILVIKLTACSLYPINSGEGPLATAINDQGDQDLSEAGPTGQPSEEPRVEPTDEQRPDPRVEPSAEPTEMATPEPTELVTPEPTETVTPKPTVKPTTEPTAKVRSEPTVKPTAKPTAKATAKPTVKPTAKPTAKPTTKPTAKPTAKPTPEPTVDPDLAAKWEGLVKGSPVYGILLRDQEFYDSQYNDKKVIGIIKEGSKVTIRGQGYVLSMCNIIYDGKRGYVPYDALEIPEDPATNPHRLSKEDLEEYANLVGRFKSDTDYYIWTDIDRQRTYIFKGGNGNWSLIHDWECTTGLNRTPTTRGHFKTQAKKAWHYNERLESGLYYYTQFNGGYVFHSVTYTKDKKLLDDRLGVRASAGCVRLATENAKWIYDNIPRNTGVWIH